MRVHIVGIGGTFMAGVALIARQCGYSVSGCDQQLYPPMSDVLQRAGIEVYSGYDPQQLDIQPDWVIIGNAFSRGNPLVEEVLRRGLPYVSGPEWLHESLLRHRHVLAVSGTHGKTTTSSLLAWILQSAGLKPGYLIGGVAKNFEQPADCGEDPYFVIEADEYDTAFFDKRAKFVHYRPQTLLINNLEYDHADIYPDLHAIQTQFHHLVRTVPPQGQIIIPVKEPSINEVLAKGVWSETITFGLHQGDWQVKEMAADGSEFELWHQQQRVGKVAWPLFGVHNVYNALAASAAVATLGLTSEQIVQGLQTFEGVKRRLEVFSSVDQITFYDDFAHHPTAIKMTLSSLRARVGSARIVVMLQCGSRTMQLGVHRETLADALSLADRVVLLDSDELHWDLSGLQQELGAKAMVYSTVREIVDDWSRQLQPLDHVLLMSNKSFDGIYDLLLTQLRQREARVE